MNSGIEAVSKDEVGERRREVFNSSIELVSEDQVG